MIQLSRTGPQRAEVTAIHQQSLNLQDTDFQDFKVLTKD
jgi:acylphosphatase